ncbi:hypothetical protein HRbin01_00120 [archaeon HR01]|nr:hypothetical protein HRbin01_00120 [archaeon HR01]
MVDALKKYWAVMAIALASWGVSLILHYPDMPWTVYSDVVSLWYREMEGGGGIPCIDFFLEYPPASCFLLAASSFLGGSSLASYYLVFGLLSLPAYIVFGLVIHRLYIGNTPGKFMALASPSLIVYGIYNFDHFVAAAVALSIYLHIRGRNFLSALSLGLAVSLKLIPVILLPLYLSKNPKHVVSGFLTGITPYLPVAFLNPEYFPEFYRFHSGWGLENAWFLWLSGDPFSTSAKLFGFWLMIILLLRSYFSGAGFEVKSFQILSAWFLTSYVFTPQMALWLLPTVPAIGSVADLWPAVEISNVLIIYTWFTTPTPTLPWTLPQTAALVRAAALASIFFLSYRQGLHTPGVRNRIWVSKPGEHHIQQSLDSG